MKLKNVGCLLFSAGGNYKSVSANQIYLKWFDNYCHLVIFNRSDWFLILVGTQVLMVFKLSAKKLVQAMKTVLEVILYWDRKCFLEVRNYNLEKDTLPEDLAKILEDYGYNTIKINGEDYRESIKIF